MDILKLTPSQKRLLTIQLKKQAREARQRASRENGRLGGRPLTPQGILKRLECFFTEGE